MIALALLMSTFIAGTPSHPRMSDVRLVHVQQAPPEVTGTWGFEIDIAGSTGTPTVTFKQDGDKLTGTYSSVVVGERPITGTVKGSAVTFSFDASLEGAMVKVTYTGTVEGSSMKGTVRLGDLADGTFTGKKK